MTTGIIVSVLDWCAPATVTMAVTLGTAHTTRKLLRARLMGCVCGLLLETVAG